MQFPTRAPCRWVIPVDDIRAVRHRGSICRHAEAIGEIPLISSASVISVLSAIESPIAEFNLSGSNRSVQPPATIAVVEGRKGPRIVAPFYSVPVDLYCLLQSRQWTVVVRMSGYKAGKA